jgi:TolB-like protein/Flp pilus assembly protein TadD
MNPARFQTIEHIYREALDQQPDQISAFLDRACDGDAVLRHKVEALLSSRQRADSFIETSAIGLAAKIIQNGQADLLIGQTIGHYKISEQIGAGGMGEVYLATDMIAGRKAALKLLPFRFTSDAERLKRFQQEALAVVGLNHPNILTVYEIGEDHSIQYIASELIEGETLRDRLTRGPMHLNEAVDIAIQVASALAAAHQAGIVHRDIKPENIMLRPDGYVKVLDFGIAKLAEEEVPTTIPRDEALLLIETNLGSILGTVHYMSPEQACGEQVDKSTDIWSLGVVFYEMVTGHVPFSGDPPSQSFGAAGTPKEVMTSILEKEPAPLARYVTRAPTELQQIISKTLHKDRKERHQSASEMLQSLKNLRHKLEVEAELEHSAAGRSWHRRVALAALVLGLLVAALALALPFYQHRNLPTSRSPEKSIAVLPFENLSEEKANAYFAEGVQNEILTRLATVRDLKVISRTSTAKYKSKPDNLKKVAQELGVSTVLEGAVQKAGDKVRVNLQLIDARSDTHLWADTFDRKLSDIFSVESEVAKAIADQLRAKLTGQEEQAISAKPTDNVDAYDAYLRGLAFDARSVHTIWSPDLGVKAAGFYEQAVELDQKFALAWACLARVNAHLYFEGTRETTSAQREVAKRALEKAQKLEPNSPETLLALGYYQYWVLRDFGAAKTTFGRVSKMLPNSSEVPMALGRVARREGHWDESVAYFERALALDPRNVEWLLDLAETYGLVRQFSAALKLYDRVLDISPNDPDVMAVKASIYQAQGNLQGAGKLLSEIDAQPPADLAFEKKIIQLRFERNCGEAVRLLQARLAQFHYDSDDRQRAVDQTELAFVQRVAGDWTGAKVTAEQSRDILEPLYGDESHMPRGRAELARVLSQAYAVMGDKDSALKTAAQAVTLLPRANDPKLGPGFEENLALIQTMFGENDQAISTLAQLLQTSYNSPLYGPSAITAAHLRLDPIWDPIRNDPRFGKILEESENTVTLTTILPPQKSIAVLPFENASKEPNSEYLSEGISEALINSLSELQQLRVMARPTAFRYKGKDVDPRQVGRELGVAAVLTGKVRQMQDALSIQVDLVDATTGAQLWGAGYERKMSDVIAVKQAIAREITEKLKLKLSGEEQRRLVKRDSTNAEAYQFYLRGRYFWNKRTPDGIKRAFEQFQQAIEHDPNFALGYVGLADSYTALTFYNFAAPHEAMPKAKESALKALALDNTVAEAHASLAHILMNYYWDWPTAEKEFKRSIELKPDYATAHQWYAIHYLTATGRLEEAVQEMKKALQLEPASLVMNTFMGATLYYAGRYDEAIDQCRRTIEMDPNFGVAHWHLGLAYEREQVFDAAIEEFQKAISLSGGSPLMRAALGHAYAMSQRTYEANKILGELNDLSKQQYVSPYEVAAIYVALGSNDQAFQLLEKAYTEHSFHLVNLNVSPRFKSVRSDPRFQSLVRRIGLLQ